MLLPFPTSSLVPKGALTSFSRTHNQFVSADEAR